MTRYRFDPSRLRYSGKDPSRMAGRLLREYLGGDPLAEAGRRLRSDPRFRELIDELRVAAAQADKALRDELGRRGARASRH